MGILNHNLPLEKKDGLHACQAVWPNMPPALIAPPDWAVQPAPCQPQPWINPVGLLFLVWAITPPGVHERSSVLQSMLRFATESKYQEEGRKTRQDGIDWWKSHCFQCWRRGGSKERKSRSGKRRKRRAKQGTTRQNQGWVEQGTLGKASLVQESKKQKQEDQERWQ